jgi:tetratricopeptide (TPR) repeat protein
LPELEYIFKHSLTQEAAYNSLLIERRKEFHSKVGEAIERLFDERAEELTGLLAHHWERAGKTDKAVQYLLQAGERARRLHAHLEALGYYDRALDLMDEENESYIPTLRHRAHVNLEIFRCKESVADFEMLQAFAQEQDDRSAELETLLGLGRGNYICSLDETDIEYAFRSKRYYEEAYELAKELGDQAGMIKALVPTTWFSDFWPEYEELEISQDLGDEELIIESKLALANTVKLPQREQIGEELRTQLEQRNDLPRLNRTLFRLMFTHLGLGNFKKCVETCDAGVEVAKRIGVPPVQYATIRAFALIWLGRFDEARASLEKEIADDAHRFGRAFRDTGYGIYYLEMHAYRKASETFKSSIEQADQVGRAWLVDVGRYHLARTLLDSETGKVSEIEEILNHFDPSDMFRALIFGKHAYSNGEFVQAVEIADKIIEFGGENGRRPALAEGLLLKTMALLASGQPEPALEVAQEGIAVADEIKYLPILWRLHLNKAQALEGLDKESESEHEFDAASKIINELAANISEESLRRSFLSDSEVVFTLSRASTSTTEQIQG